MSFLAPAAFALALLLPVIVAMYLLKLRRTEQLVSSVYLWRRMVRDVEANAPWQRLRRNLLLLVQLLFLIALILALTRPFTWVAGAGGQAAIMILDVSASMAATDVSPNRMEAAKTQARQLVNNLSEETRVTVIAAGEGAQVLVASSRDRRQILEAINSVQVGLGNSNLAAALQLASAIAVRQPDTEIIVLSDGRVELPERLALKGTLSYYPIGLSGDNQAISLLSLEPALGSGAITAFAQISNYGDEAASRRLEFYAGEVLVNVFDLEIAPKSQRVVIAEDLPPDTYLIEARLTGRDALPLDDQAWAVYRRTDPAAIRLITPGNLFLETALGLLPGVELTSVNPEEFGGASGNESPGENQPDKLTIFDSFLPPTTTLPGGNLFFIAPPHSTEFFTVTGALRDPVLRPVNMVDPLLLNVSLSGINVLDAARIVLPGWARSAIVGDFPGDEGSMEGESIPLLFTGEVDGRRVAVLAFDLRHSDLPLQVAFPLLLSNLIGWLAPGGGDGAPTEGKPGTAVSIPVPLDADSLNLTRPDGSRVSLAIQAGQVALVDITQLGVYRIDQDGTQAEFAVNLFSPQESDLRPAGTLPIQGAGGDAVAGSPQHARREWWRLLAFTALALLSLEWMVYQRSTLVRIRASVIGKMDHWKASRSVG